MDGQVTSFEDAKVKHLNFGQVLLDQDLRILGINAFVALRTGVGVDACQGRLLVDAFPSLDGERLAVMVARLRLGGGSSLVEGASEQPLWPDMLPDVDPGHEGRQLSLLTQLDGVGEQPCYCLTVLPSEDLAPVYEQSRESQALANQRMMQSEKLAAIGQLAAGVAHEINNPVGFVFSNLKTLGEYVRDLIRIVDEVDTAADLEALREFKKRLDYDYIRSDVGSLLLESEDGVDRVKTIIGALKDFSHIGEEEFRLTDLHRGLDTTLNVVNNELKYKAEVVKEYCDMPQVECIPSQINQVAMNLMVNAAHAIEEFGKITIKTGHEGDWVWFEVRDTGKGMEAAVMSRIFEPFFTTKPVGKGTGLGLALSYSIVQKHHGRIEVESQLGQGTCFRVWLPKVQPMTGANAEEVA